MSCLSILQLSILATFFFTLITTSNAIPSPLEIEVRALGSPNQVRSQQLPPRQFQYREETRPVTTEISPYHSSEPDGLALVESPLAKRQRNALQHFRVGTMFILWSGTRLNSILNPSPQSDGVVFQSLKNMYTQIRRAAINEWAKLPQKSYLRIICGQLIFIILPPADRTVPWTLVEEVAYTLLLMTAAGMGGLVTGTYPVMAATGVVWYYLAIIAPGPEEQSGGGRTGRVNAPAGVTG